MEVSHTVWIEGENEDDNQKVEEKSEISTKQKQSYIPVPREKSAWILVQLLLNYRVLNNPAAHGPKEWQHQVPTTEETGYISVDYAMIGATLEDDPISLKEAKERSDWPKLKEAMDAKMDQLTKRGMYKLVELPPDCKAIASKWVFHIKRDHNGKIVKYKARLVAKGFSQIPGIDFVETFAPVMRLETFRLLMALATKLGLLIHVVDVVGAYFNGTLQETIYMAQPPDCDNSTGRVSLLIKALYRLRQAGQAWNNELNQSFLELEYTRLFSDQCVYIHHQECDLILAIIHTDDITMLGSDIDAIKKAKAELGKYFTITDLGEAKQVVGLELERNLEEGTLKLSQTQYIQRTLEKFGMADSHPVSTPLDPNVKLIKLPSMEHYDIPDYRSAIGSLIYVAIGTRPDISFAVQHLSQFMTSGKILLS